MNSDYNNKQTEYENKDLKLGWKDVLAFTIAALSYIFPVVFVAVATLALILLLLRYIV